MHRFCFLTVVICLALADQTRAVDLAKIDRSLRKEPTYESKHPQYCLLVFGPQANLRARRRANRLSLRSVRPSCATPWRDHRG
jgi:hypothetical protein